MDRYTKYLKVVMLVGVLVSGLITPAAAQSILLPPTVEAVGTAINADDTDIWAVCRYVGPSGGTSTTTNSGTIEVEADTDIVFKSGAQGSEAADTSLECPVSGALGGIIDVDDAACDTMGEIIDIVNAPTSNFRCVLVDALRSDVANDRILQTAATRATTPTGLALRWDTSTAFDMSALVAPAEYRTILPYLPLGSRTLKHDVWNNTRAVVLLANDVSTYGGGSSTLRVYSVDVKDTSPATGKTAETVTEMYSEASGATTVAKVFDLGAPIGVACRKNEKCLVRNDNTTAMATALLKVFGYVQRLGPP